MILLFEAYGKLVELLLSDSLLVSHAIKLSNLLQFLFGFIDHNIFQWSIIFNSWHFLGFFKHFHMAHERLHLNFKHSRFDSELHSNIIFILFLRSLEGNFLCDGRLFFWESPAIDCLAIGWQSVRINLIRCEPIRRWLPGVIDS